MKHRLYERLKGICMHFISLLVGIITLFFAPHSLGIFQPMINTTQIDEQTYQITLSIPIAQGDALYSDYISFSIDHPEISLSQWSSSQEPKSRYDADFKQTKKVF